jgi:hypothetical protein
MAPAPGENLNDYRDRMIPVVQRLVEPQRQRVRDARARFEQVAALDARQKEALDAAADQAAEAILDRVLQGALSGELRPGMSPMTAIAAARDLLDALLAAEQRFKAALGADQSAAMAGFPVRLRRLRPVRYPLGTDARPGGLTPVFSAW